MPGYDELLGLSVPSCSFEKSPGDFLTDWVASYPGVNTGNKKFVLDFMGWNLQHATIPLNHMNVNQGQTDSH